MTTEELEQIRKIIREEIEAEAKTTQGEIKILRMETRTGLNKVAGRVKDVEISNIRQEKKIDALTEDMGDFFNKTWEKMNETNDRVTIIEDHLGLRHPSKN